MSMASFPPLPPDVKPPPPAPPQPPPSAASTLSTLTSLVSLSTATLSEFFTLLPPSPSPSLIACPFNPNHRLPHSSLFVHYLNCPHSPKPLNAVSLLSSLHYPHTLKPQPNSPSNLIVSIKDPNVELKQPKPTPTSPNLDSDDSSVGSNLFYLKPQQPYNISTLPSLDSDLTICLKESNFESNFFYLDCPGVVTFPGINSPLKEFILPKILSSECADFVDSSFDCDNYGRNGAVRLLGSEIWAIRSEIERWNDYPDSYSYCIVRGFWALGMSNLEDFGSWVVANSPRFGIVVDLAMAAHIGLLVRLCLKAVFREALAVVENDEDKQRSWGGRRFCCPVLRSVMMWLGSQLGILYGEVNGKGFAISMLKHCLSDSSWSSSLFSVKNGENRLEDLKGAGMNYENSAGGKICGSAIFVYQVAAAVAALYERQMLEVKIRALWDSRPTSSYQRVLELENICKAADIERQKRPNYRPLLEHDSLFRQQSHGQDSNKAKTREEILAEERDYKRRRISYRGKKAMRSTTEVMRYIIEEHMEELKHATEMECSVKTIEDKQDLESITYTGHASSTNTSRNQQSESIELSSKYGRGREHDYGEPRLHLGSDGTTSIDRSKREQYTRDPVHQRSRHDKEDHYVSQHRQPSRHERRDSSRSPNRQKRKYKREGISSSPERSKRDKKYSSRSPEKRRDSSRSPNRQKRKYKREDISSSPERSKRDKEYSSRSPEKRVSSRHRYASDVQVKDEKLISGNSYHVSEKSYTKKSERHSHREERGHKPEVREKSRGKTHQRHKSTFGSYDRYDSYVEYNKFEDRYDPSESYAASEPNRCG